MRENETRGIGAAKSALERAAERIAKRVVSYIIDRERGAPHTAAIAAIIAEEYAPLVEALRLLLAIKDRTSPNALACDFLQSTAWDAARAALGSEGKVTS